MRRGLERLASQPTRRAGQVEELLLEVQVTLTLLFPLMHQVCALLWSQHKKELVLQREPALPLEEPTSPA